MEQDPRRPGICVCGQRMNMNDQGYCVPDDDDNCIEQRIAAMLVEHRWWLAGNLGVPGMPDWTTYKCKCGWNGDDPDAHVASVLVSELGLREEEVADFTGGRPTADSSCDRPPPTC